MDHVESIRLLPSEPGLAQDVLDFVTRLGGALVSEVLRDRPQPSEWAWQLPNDVTLYYIEDSAFNAKYVVFNGVGARAIADEFRTDVPCWDLEQIVARWDNSADSGDPEELIDLISAIGLLAPEVEDAGLSARFLAALNHPEAAVRFAAVFAAKVLSWPNLVQALRDRQRVEVHPRVQEALDVALAD